MRISSNQMAQQSLFSMLDQQAKLSKTQLQLSAMRRILTPADDPTGSSRALELDKSIQQFAQYKSNAEQSKLRLSLSDATLGEVDAILVRVRELTIQAKNAPQDATNRRAIAAEVQERLAQLVQLANTQDGSGEYLFAGSNTRSQPFVHDGGAVAYTGDQVQRQVQVGPTRQLAVDHSGFEVFMKIPNGTGRLSYSADPANTGTGIIGVSLRDPAAYADEAHRIDFVANADGRAGYVITNTVTGAMVQPAPPQVTAGSDISFDGVTVPYDPAWAAGDSVGLDVDGDGVDDHRLDFVTDASGALAYTVTNTADNALVVPAPGELVEGESINFNGVSVTFTGQPRPGDSFTVEPSRPQSVFESIQRILTALQSSGDTPEGSAAFNNIANRALDDLTQASDSINRIRGEIGGRINALESELDMNASAVLELKTSLSQVEDLDYTEAVSRLNMQMLGLKAAQQVYVKVQGLTLFNFL